PTLEEGGGSVPIPFPPPFPGDDHQGPGPMTGGGPTGGTGPPPPHLPLPGFDYTAPPALPPAPPGWERFVAEHGVWPSEIPNGFPDGWPPSRPEDAGYSPKPGETKELIRCEGTISFAYKANCIDFLQATPGAKWKAQIAEKISLGVGGAWDTMRKWI